jgi:CelD/BcsL family acetyltransferase involved in cellulose biosynthesis
MTVISLPRVHHDAERAHALSPASKPLKTSVVGAIRVTLYRDFEQVESVWRALESDGACVPAQTWVRSKSWFRQVCKPGGSEAAIVCGESRSGETQFIWPFKVCRTPFGRCLRWIGSEHANYLMGLHRLQFARRVKAPELRALLLEAAGLIGDVHAAILTMQPFEWDGVPNPFAILPRFRNANAGHAILLDADFDTLYRNRFGGKSRNTLRRKERKLREERHVQLGWAQTPTERKVLLDELFRQKSLQFANESIANTFADLRQQAFYHDLAARPTGQGGTLEIGYLIADDVVAALSCGMFFKDKFIPLISSIDEGPTRKYSPGSILLHFQIEEACKRGLNFFDMGASDARHKSEWCDVRTSLFDTVIAFDERGYLCTLPYIATTVAKRFIKTRPYLWSLGQSARRRIYGRNDKR